MLDRLDDPTCPHEHVVEEFHDTRRLVNGEVSGDIDVEVICTDCGERQDHQLAALAAGEEKP